MIIEAREHDRQQAPRDRVIGGAGRERERPEGRACDAALLMMRASTGNAVTDIAAPRYIMLCQPDTPAAKNRPSA